MTAPESNAARSRLPADVPLRDRFVGCLLGCAVGDALGAPFEGLWARSIPDESALLSAFAEFEGYPSGQFTDDTQLTVATVRSVVATGGVSPDHVARSIFGLFKRQEVIGPGGACMAAAANFLRTRDATTCGAEPGQAGNGAAMRTAALGLAFLDRPDELPESVASVSRITHRDPRSVAGGVAVAKAAQLLASAPETDPVALCQVIAAVVDRFSPEFADWIVRLPGLVCAPAESAAPVLAWAGMPAPELDAPIITPFVIPTVLASLWCLLRNRDSWPGAVAAAIRLGGDVDTLGAIVGALAGVRHGVGAIPAHLREGVQQGRELEALAVRYHALVARSV